MKIVTLKSEQIIQAFKGLKKENFALLDEVIRKLAHLQKKGFIEDKEIKELNLQLGNAFHENTIHGYGLKKPFGYAGDFMLIDKIYTRHITDDEKFKIYDEYFHYHVGTEAVRNRKKYFKELMKRKLGNKQEIKLLNVASGPARDLMELYDELKDTDKNKINSTCIDMDEHAIEYAKRLNKKHLNKIQFKNKNIFRYKEEQKYDVIWSAGLFQ
jgi:extracellular factor (EF) 3-hydroxypalmitic acid methyl ester biosynthesis protein